MTDSANMTDRHRLIVSGAYAHCSCGVEFYFPTHAQQYGDHRAAVATGGPVGPVGSGPTPISPVAGQDRHGFHADGRAVDPKNCNVCYHAALAAQRAEPVAAGQDQPKEPTP